MNRENLHLTQHHTLQLIRIITLLLCCVFAVQSGNTATSPGGRHVLASQTATPEQAGNDTLLEDIKPPVTIKVSRLEQLTEVTQQPKTMGLILGCLALLGMAYLFYKKRSKDEQVPPSAREKTLQKLSEAQQCITADQPEKFVILVDQALRIFLADRFAVPVNKLTGRECILRLTEDTSNISDELDRNLPLIEQWFTHSDQVKFARARLDGKDMETILTTIQNLIAHSQKETLP